MNLSFNRFLQLQPVFTWNWDIDDWFDSTEFIWWTLFSSFPPLEKPIWYCTGWRKLATTAGPSCAAPTFRVAPTPWHMSTAGAKRVDPPLTHGTALYTKAAPPAWKSSFLYSATHTATPNSDETRRVLLSLFFFFSSCKNDISDWCSQSVTLSSKRL